MSIKYTDEFTSTISVLRNRKRFLKRQLELLYSNGLTGKLKKQKLKAQLEEVTVLLEQLEKRSCSIQQRHLDLKREKFEYRNTRGRTRHGTRCAVGT